MTTGSFVLLLLSLVEGTEIMDVFVCHLLTGTGVNVSFHIINERNV